MALTLVSGNLVWSAVKNYLSQDNAVLSNKGTNPACQGAFNDLKAYLSQQRRNLQLQFIPFAAEDCHTVDGLLPVGAVACTLYGVYARTRSTWATASFFGINDSATTDATTTTILTHRFNAVKQSFAYINGDGFPIATELEIYSSTAVAGDSVSATVDCPDGFVIIGA